MSEIQNIVEIIKTQTSLRIDDMLSIIQAVGNASNNNTDKYHYGFPMIIGIAIVIGFIIIAIVLYTTRTYNNTPVNTQNNGCPLLDCQQAPPLLSCQQTPALNYGIYSQQTPSLLLKQSFSDSQQSPNQYKTYYNSLNNNSDRSNVFPYNNY